jgi:hypothetical protein
MAKKVFSIILIILLIPFLAATILLFNFKTSLLNSGFLEQGLIKADFYNQIVKDALVGLVKISGENGRSGLSLGPLDQNQVVGVVEKALPASFIQGQVESSLNGLSNFISGASNNFSTVISLADAKKTLVTGLQQQLDSNWATLPPCSDPYVFGGQLASDCKPQNVTNTEVAHDILYGDSGVLNKVPDDLKINSDNLVNNTTIVALKNVYHGVGLAANIVLVVSLFLLLFLILLNLSPISVLLRVLSVPLIVSSGILLVMTLVFHLIFFTVTLASLNFGLPESLIPLKTALINAFIGRFLLQTEITSGIILVIGIVLLIIAFYLRRRDSAQTPLNLPSVKPFDSAHIRQK